MELWKSVPHTSNRWEQRCRLHVRWNWTTKRSSTTRQQCWPNSVTRPSIKKQQLDQFALVWRVKTPLVYPLVLSPTRNCTVRLYVEQIYFSHSTSSFLYFNGWVVSCAVLEGDEASKSKEQSLYEWIEKCTSFLKAQMYAFRCKIFRSPRKRYCLWYGNVCVFVKNELIWRKLRRSPNSN